MRRVLTALFLIPPVVYVIHAAHSYVFLAATAAVALASYYEFVRIAAGHGIQRRGPLGYAAGLVLVGAPRLDATVTAGLAVLAMIEALRERDPARMLPRSAAFVLGLAYAFAPWRCAVLLRETVPDGGHWLLYALALTWIGDGAAYYVGSRIGRHKLAPGISPGKSWEGAAAHVVSAVLFGWAYLGRFVPAAPLLEVVLLTAAASIAGQAGDLCESAMKRGAGLKDSGSLLPGHGGWLDRVDACLFSVPVVYFWVARSIFLGN
jgi:phosphatidate cytidylyltransferase